MTRTMSKRVALVAMLMLLGIVASAAEPFTYPKARTAQARYERAVENAEREMESAMQAARARYQHDLREALQDLTRAGRLEEAVKVREVIESLQSAAARNPLDGVWATRFTDGYHLHIRLHDGKVIALHPDGSDGEVAEILESGGSLVVRWSSGSIWRHTFSEKRIWIERWTGRNRGGYPSSFPSNIGIGERYEAE